MSKRKNKSIKKVIKQRNWIAVHAFQRSGSGAHNSKKKYSRKEKHKNKSTGD